MYARLKQSRLGRLLAPLLLDAERYARFRALPSNIRAHNLAKGIPFPDNSIDIVYHSHVLEHLDREIAEKFMHEVRRVLRPHGIQRIVVPDFEQLCRDYTVAYLAVRTIEPRTVSS
ncbi:class I SAM-dependent methyltransferase [Chloroflexus aggregans]|uniref:class I SAM-dependent methyltransferase n=1 Tax=Chloroflexus aggregans TaxID=152260 RepID=UPI0002F77FBB|nr:methyltransferase domain-containing protein [Chloroflexus aggregans]